MREAYRLKCSSANLGTALKSAFPDLFPYYELIGAGKVLTDYYPNEWTLGLCSTGFLDYIGAPTAWGISKGDANVIIGITDTYFDMTNPDLSGKVAMLRYDTAPPASHPSHGTRVAGLVASATDNAYACPAMGFNCKMDLSSFWANDNEMLLLSHNSNNSSKVLSASWMYGSSPTLNIDNHFYAQGVYDEIYENGTFTVIAAGNGYGTSAYGPNGYTYPASLNHNFSVTSIGWGNPNNGPGSFNVVDVHDKLVGYPDSSYNHNDRVDLCAPGLMVGTLDYDPNDTSVHYTWSDGWGTSFAAPIVAGTAGLILSANPCLTPYQVEYILKKSANHNIYTLPENQPYAGTTDYNGKLGAGKLEAGVSLENTKKGKVKPDTSPYSCNNPATQTFTIEGIELNTVCKPGSASNGVKPKLIPILKNGIPPYTYHWSKSPDNHTTLDNYNIAEPTIISSYGDNVAYYRLTVYDNSEIQKVADRMIRIQLTDADTFDLAMRDNYMDMMDEPNSMTDLDPRIWDLWTSPDIWNRKLQDGGETPQNPEYFTNNPNYVYFRVRNIGCAASPANADIRLYWSKASTGEDWPYDWDGSTQIPGSNGLVLVGNQITSVSGMTLPVLQPGEDTVMNTAWYPPDPHTFYGSPDEVDACLLARIVTNTHPPYGMAYQEQTGHTLSTNVRNNNNIVTRNMLITDLYPGDVPQIHWVAIHNPTAVNGIFRIELLNDRSINPYFSGDFSAIGYVTVYLGDLYDRWVSAGSHGTFAATNPDQKSVSFDGSDSLWLGDIPINAHERFPVKLAFQLRDGVNPNENEFLLHLRQFDQSNPNQVYGAVNFLVKTHPKAGTQSYFVPDTIQNRNSDIRVYPNPATDRLNIELLKGKETLAQITIYDVYGRLVLRQNNKKLGTVAINIAGLASGVYFVQIRSNNGLNEEHKFVKK